MVEIWLHSDLLILTSWNRQRWSRQQSLSVLQESTKWWHALTDIDAVKATTATRKEKCIFCMRWYGISWGESRMISPRMGKYRKASRRPAFIPHKEQLFHSVTVHVAGLPWLISAGRSRGTAVTHQFVRRLVKSSVCNSVQLSWMTFKVSQWRVLGVIYATPGEAWCGTLLVDGMDTTWARLDSQIMVVYVSQYLDG